LNVIRLHVSLKDTMDDISELLLGPQRSPTSTFGIVLAVIAVGLAGVLMIYLLRCYVQEARIRKRVKQRVHQPCGGNIVLSAKSLSETRRLRNKSSRILPAPHRDNGAIKLRRRSPHPWKQDRFRTDSPTPH
jgi:hypothetical protein